MELNLVEKERKILKFWLENTIFSKSIKRRTGARDFVFYEGPPTANAKPGIHHVLSRVYKDVVCRYKTMRGYRVLRKAGWDTHGLPVELEMEKKLGFKTKKDIEEYGIARFNKKCRQSVWEYKKDWERLTERIGFWLDMEHPYITYENDYIETLWWIIKRIWEKGLLYRDYKVVPHCPRCGTSLSSHEVALGYKRIKEPAIYIKFQITNHKFQTNLKSKTNHQGSQQQDSKFFLLVWTTTPWTLPGNVAVAVNPELIYVAAKQGNEVFIIAKERVSVLGDGYEILNEYRGKDLFGIEYEPLFPLDKGEKKYSIIPGTFVSAQEGTGLVHIAPAFGEEDMDAVKMQNAKIKNQNEKSKFKNNEIPILVTVDEEGKMRTPGYKWDKLFVKDADPLIIEELKERGLLFKEEKYEHDYPFCWRCSSPLLYYAKESWFIKMTAVKDKLLENNKKINWVPPHLKEGRFGEWLKEVKDWAFSRERYWGTPLPLWECRKCGSIKAIGSKKELLAQRFTTNRYLVLRHGHSLRQVTNKISSWPEKFRCPLTREGMQQVREVAGKLRKEGVDIIYASDLLRTRQTAEIIARELNVPVKFDKRLRELDGGTFNGKHISILQEWGRWDNPKDRFHVRVPGGEHYGDAKKRMYRFLLDVDRKHRGKTILIVSHELPISVLEGAVRGFSNEEILDYRAKKRIGVGEYRVLPFAVLPYDERGNLDFHRPFIDSVRFLCERCGEYAERVPEIADVWFDSGAMPFAQAHWPFAWSKIQNSELKIQSFTKKGFQFPADYICEAVDQTRGWFYTLLAVSVLLGFGAPYRNVVSLGHVLDEKGEKMSKSKGNVVDPWQVIERYGADAVRWYFFTLNQPGDSKLFAEKDVRLALQRFLLIFWNSYVFWETYNRKITNSKSQITNKFKIQIPKSKNILDRWVLSRLNSLGEAVTEKMDAYDVTGAAREIEKFVVADFSQWYVRRSRRRLQKPKTKKEFQEASGTFAYVLFELSKLVAPFIPFFAEELYQKLGGRGSVHLEDWPKVNRKRRDMKVEREVEVVRKIAAFALAHRSKEKIGVRQPLAKLSINLEDFGYGGKRLRRDSLEIIKEEINVKKIEYGETSSLDTTITPELREEGLLRELVRHIQNARKEAGLKPHEAAVVFYEASDPISQLFSKYQEELRAETRTRSFLGKKTVGMREVSIEGEKMFLAVKRA